jgi:hypothetical protein
LGGVYKDDKNPKKLEEMVQERSGLTSGRKEYPVIDLPLECRRNPFWKKEIDETDVKRKIKQNKR